MRAELGSLDRMASVLKSNIDHEGVQTLLEVAATCDEAYELFAEGNYELALQTALPLVLLETPVVTKRAREIAISALDELVEQAIAEDEPKRALKYLDQWLQLDPKAMFPLLRRAEIYQYGLYDLDSAWTAYLKVLRLYPTSIEALLGLAQLAMAEGHPERAYPYVLRAWQTLSSSQWGYTPCRRTFCSVFEDLYDLTAGLLQWLDAHEEARHLTEKALALIEESELLKERLNLINELDEP